MTNVMITGGTGSIGLAIAEVLIATGSNVVLFGDKEPPPGFYDTKLARADGLKISLGDVRNRDRIRDVITRYKIDHMVHGAAITPSGNDEFANPEHVIDVNIQGGLNALKVSAELHVRSFINLSSIAVYGGEASRGHEFISESTGQDPRNLYEITKFSSERLIRRIAPSIAIPTISLRLGDLFGKWEYRSGSRQTTSAIHQVTEN